MNQSLGQQSPEYSLVIVASTRLGEITAYDPDEFRIPYGFWASREFESRVGSKARSVASLPERWPVVRKLLKDANDRKIISELGSSFLWNESELCARIKQMTSAQPGGKEGSLRNDGLANIFYTIERSVVLVHWRRRSREWRTYARKIGGRDWSAGVQVLSLN